MKRLLVLTFLFLVALGAEAQDKSGQDRVFSLEDCLKIAADNNTSIRFSKANISVADADLTSAFGDFLPSLNYYMGFQRQLNETNTRNLDGTIITIPVTEPNSFTMAATANFLVFGGFARGANYSRAENNYESTLRDVEFTEKQVFFTVYDNYIDVIANRQIVKIREENLKTGQKELEKLRAEYEAGTKNIGEVYAQEANVGTRELELVRAENTLELSKATLLTTMGLRADYDAEFMESSLPNEITDERIQLFRDEIGTIEQLMTKALESRLDYKANEYRIKAAEDGVTVAQSSYYPRLTASGGWSWANSRFENIGELGRSYVGLSLSVPIFQNFNTQYQVESAKATVLQQEIAKIDNEQKIRSDLIKSYTILEAAEKELDITQRALKSAELNYESAKERYQVGVYNITDLFSANYQLTDARINRVNAVYNYYLAQKQVLFTIGNL